MERRNLVSDMGLAHVIVTGHGRSGSNMLLDILDCNPVTFCRNEPNKLLGSRLAALGSGFFEDPAGATSAAFLDGLEAARRCNGNRDRFLDIDKRYHRHPLLARLGNAAMKRTRIRNVLLKLRSHQSLEEWPCPAVYVNPRRLSAALPVFKLLLYSGRIAACHPDLPAQKVLHIMRSPEGFLRSWINRYVRNVPGGEQQVFEENCQSLAPILRFFDVDPERYARYSFGNLLETELWRWRYVNELLSNRIGNSPRYLRIGYAEMLRNPIVVAEQVYRHANIEFDGAVEARVGALENRIFSRPHTVELENAPLDAAIAAVLHDSPLRTFPD